MLLIPYKCHWYVQEKSALSWHLLQYLYPSFMSSILEPALHHHILWKILVFVSCRWWGIHQGPPALGHFLLTSTHYLGSWSRNYLKSLGTCMPQRKVSSLSAWGSHHWPLTRKSCGVRCQLIYSHLIDYT